MCVTHRTSPRNDLPCVFLPGSALGGRMQKMIKGANVGLAALSENVGSVVMSLGWSSPTGEGDADVSVLLLDGNGKVRSDADFCFYNNPVVGNGSVQLLGKTPTADGDEDRISFDLDAVPPEVERVVVAASRYGGARFGDLNDLHLTLADGSGDSLVQFSIEDAGAVSACIFGELYRRDGAWKFRAVGQGYESGLAGLATDFGVDIDDDAGAEGAGETPGADAPDRDAPDQGAPDGDVSEASGRREGPLPALPSPRAPEPGPAVLAGTGATASGEPKPRARPRTARKKVTLPRTAKKTLAENDSWRTARLFPLSALKNDRERETRATSVLLSVMTQVPEFGRRLTAGFGAPAGRMETFTEVSLPHGDSPRRPDGVIRVERAGKLWTALVETKTNGNALRPDQVQAYMDIAARRGYEAVITLSNDVALEGSPLVDVRIDGRRKHKVALWHLSWAEVAHQAQMLIRHEGVGNATHAWLLQELLHYLQHEHSGCHGFQNMGAAWVPVRKGIDDETLCQGDPRAMEVIESWERLVRQVCLRLGGELGHKVLPVQRAKRGSDPRARRADLADQLCSQGRLHSELRIEGTPGILALTADLRTGKLRTSIEVAASEQGYPLSRAKRLVRQLAAAPADLHIETLVDGGTGPRGTLERLRPEPGNLLPKDGADIAGFRLSLFKGMGNGRGNAESGFIRSVDDAVDRFHAQVIAHLETRGTRRPAGEPVAAR
ncbi:stress response protein SCP2 [Streptomyces sp. DvalAA-21]|nr:stress protein [Streptomyces sp. SirexAA-E]PZX33432.1 stress response protein SCP2 [Streptomyces sp. DvalAA-21]RAJ29315.1 stress response protein SCP2 [Streptomyces sp. DpondAA-E10]RAJ43282.1 stress response protein SCP2 [Streptomyces sp. DpondAA-A50]SCM00564.1 Stress response protein SCP2 [Streptomyces sp. DpondAA-F4]